MDSSTSVKVAVRIKPLGPLESVEDVQHCINTVPGVAQVNEHHFVIIHTSFLLNCEQLTYNTLQLTFDASRS